MVSPPQTFFDIEHSVLSVFITGIFVHIPHLVEVLLFACKFPHFGKYRHPHLDGIYPPPVVYLWSVDQHIHIGFRFPYFLRIGANVV